MLLNALLLKNSRVISLQSGGKRSVNMGKKKESSDMMIHILRGGFTYCHFPWTELTKRLPQDKWVSVEEKAKSTCPLCQREYERQMGNAS